MAAATYHYFAPGQAERQNGSGLDVRVGSGLSGLGRHVARACVALLSAVELSRALEAAPPSEQRDLALTWLGDGQDR